MSVFVCLAGRRAAAVALLALLGAILGGCAATVRPWDRDLLAQKKMSFTPIPVERAVDDHIYFSKEGSTGGSDVGGGGCGCN
ncbi:MAG: DUF4266 domain-containing protein [Candidatus Eisenbacteria bacterium]|uniref:DUF4266 domain-containing protein n=1 Tax=Eiseniibacteriota bacterium TaxID=2212470 RepID=A0A538U7B0_UNCEI|nr:MAG: DUF4266 domain-containing protein [Candidatus Eisenbacteria bacterium]